MSVRGERKLHAVEVIPLFAKISPYIPEHTRGCTHRESEGEKCAEHGELVDKHQISVKDEESCSSRYSFRQEQVDFGSYSDEIFVYDYGCNLGFRGSDTDTVSIHTQSNKPEAIGDKPVGE